MERRKFLISSVLAAPAIPSLLSFQQDANKQLYEFREYELGFGVSASQLHTYFEKTLIPALNRAGVATVGVFREYGKTDPAKVYLLIPHNSFEQFHTIPLKLSADERFVQGSADYNKVNPDKPLFKRYKTSLFYAFNKMPRLKVPAKESRFFEWRIYEGFNEDATRRKVKMFNDAEIDVFLKVKLNPVFFGEMVAGANMPCLGYMLVFKNMEERDKNWSAFSADPDWKMISQDKQYANTVSNIIRIFLEAVPYSQV
jgi:hypothetical protein